MTDLNCDHPLDCFTDDVCQWCLDLERIEDLNRDCKALHDQLNKQAFIVTRGASLVIKPGAVIGYLVVTGGTVRGPQETLKIVSGLDSND